MPITLHLKNREAELRRLAAAAGVTPEALAITYVLERISLERSNDNLFARLRSEFDRRNGRVTPPR